jgi:hypothetical protein
MNLIEMDGSTKILSDNMTHLVMEVLEGPPHQVQKHG